METQIQRLYFIAKDFWVIDFYKSPWKWWVGTPTMATELLSSSIKAKEIFTNPLETVDEDTHHGDRATILIYQGKKRFLQIPWKRWVRTPTMAKITNTLEMVGETPTMTKSPRQKKSCLLPLKI